MELNGKGNLEYIFKARIALKPSFPDLPALE
jgi:hypothetical protein